MSLPSTSKIVALIAIGALLALLAAGCGGSDSGSDGDTDAQELLDATFGGGGEEVSSGVLDLSVEAASAGESGGSLDGSLSGPFETRADDEPPLVDFDVALQVSGGSSDTDFEGGLTITEDAGFVAVGGTDYEIDPTTFETFKQVFAQSAAAQDEQGEEGAALFEQLGVDPSSWLTDVTNEGTEEIDGTEVVHISGTADVAQIVEDAQAIDPTGNAAGAGQSGALAESVDSASVDVFTGADDQILRQLDLELEIEDPGSSGETLSLKLSVGISDVNGEQSFEAPEDPQPLDELVPGGIGALGNLGLDGAGGGSAPGGGGQPGGGAGGGAGAGLEDLPPEYQQCVGNATTPEDFAQCNDLLGQ